MPELSSDSLAGARIWLSGSLPEETETTDHQRASIANFVRLFSRRVFERGGHIVHGSHPSFVPILLAEARAHQERGGRKDCLVLAVSRYFSKNTGTVPVDAWRETAIVDETPDANDRDESLKVLRKWMASRADAVVVVGGRWWQAIRGKAGVPLEIGYGIERAIPCFLLGGLGGAAHDFVLQNDHLLANLKNGLDRDQNRALSLKENVDTLAEEICRQLERLPLVRGKGSDGVSFRILALDGGGIKGMFTAAALATWEKETNLRIIDHFDLIAGTSTGGILALALGLGMPASDMVTFYREQGRIIFPMTRLYSRYRRSIQHWLWPKFSSETLFKVLEKAYYKGQGAIPLWRSKCRLVIPSYHVLEGVSHRFRTPHHPDLTRDGDTPFAEIALATSAAPTYFKAAKIANLIAENSYLDGGVWANAPAMAAVAEAVCFLKIPPERIDILSVGTTEQPFTAIHQSRGGLIKWAWKKRILDLVMNAQQESSIRLARDLVGDAHFTRINVTVPEGSYSLDSPAEIEELAGRGSAIAVKPEVLREVKSRFLNGIHAATWERFGAFKNK